MNFFRLYNIDMHEIRSLIENVANALSLDMSTEGSPLVSRMGGNEREKKKGKKKGRKGINITKNASVVG